LKLSSHLDNQINNRSGHVMKQGQICRTTCKTGKMSNYYCCYNCR